MARSVGKSVLLSPVKRVARAAVERMGYTVTRQVEPPIRPIPPDMTEANAAIWRRVEPYTLTTPERVAALCDATRYVVDAGIGGAFIECGVWRGGSAMAMALTLVEQGETDRDLYLYDTYSYLPRPEARDVTRDGENHLEAWHRYMADPTVAPAALERIPLDDVIDLVHGTGYPPEKIHFVVGDVRDTIPGTTPDAVALLRLDTDYYASTAHELAHLEPLVSDGGVVIIDDYGFFKGSQDAVDEYYAMRAPVLLHRVDETARLVVVNRTVAAVAEARLDSST